MLFRLHLAICCAESVEVLHQQNPAVVHGDIKSQNFLMSSELMVKIADLELASRCLQSSSSSSSNSMSNSMSNNNSLPSPLLLPQLQSIINDNPSSKPITKYIQVTTNVSYRKHVTFIMGYYYYYGILQSRYDCQYDLPTYR